MLSFHSPLLPKTLKRHRAEAVREMSIADFSDRLLPVLLDSLHSEAVCGDDPSDVLSHLSDIIPLAQDNAKLSLSLWDRRAGQPTCWSYSGNSQ